MNDPYRLPKSVKPLHYALTVKTDLDGLNFEGHVAIDLDILEETSTIVFNVADLDLDQVSLHSEALKTEQIQIAEQSFDKDLDRCTVQVATPLPAKSKAQLRVAFKAQLTNKMTGYYYSHTEIDGKKVYYTLTQFEPTDARKAFPCWDEPALKATYDITMISREGTVNLSNMPAISEKPLSNSNEYDDSVGKLTKMFAKLKTESSEGGWKITKFETTPLISSYLVAYANGPFEYIEDSYTSPISGKVRPVRMYATKEIIDQTKFALDVNVRCLPLYESVFNVEFPLPKLDTLVAHDFDAGAMENWGLITGRTTAYLIDE
ncbi:Aminopeptidase 2 mitochondrial, partial [Serendipita sp. 401]